MRALPKLLTVVVAGTMLPLTATSANAEPQVEPHSAPYIDVMQDAPTMPEVAEATGQLHYTAAFVLGSAQGCTPMWGGERPVDDAGIIGQFNTIRDMGGSVTVATGGAMGPYLENACGSADELLTAYKTILDVTGSNSLDVDVESNIEHDMVNEALARLQDERGTQVSYTLRVQGDDYGLDPYSVQVLESAAAHGVDVLVNPMTMEFGSDKPWGDAVIAAAESVLGQMSEIWPELGDAELKARLGVTPMIGANYNGKIFNQDHARQLVDWATANRIGMLSFWSAGRDNGSCPGGAVSPTCSSIEQTEYEFTNIFKPFGA
ncbi:hypothetical protein GCM10009854_44200 [Saccharopolyspora halophila]|uniref:Chitinase n=1 Tax=Saccharopolyspora halophila TaxID=405551 RepID=A0ABN3GTY5_9PSEU